MFATDQRQSIQAALRDFTSRPLAEAARAFLDTLGYRSDRTLDLGDSSPGAFLDYLRSNAKDAKFDETKALFADWKSADLLFQLTDEELGNQISLFKNTDIQPGLLQSYLFFAIELTGGDYARGKLTSVARQLNRVFPMPVMVLIKHDSDKKPVLSVAVINRRQNKREADKDVLGKVTIIRDIAMEDPHRGHLDILSTFAFENLIHPDRLPINNFDALHAAWEEIFNVELLNKRFYRELADWYFWAMRHAHFPLLDEKADRYFLFKEREKVREHEANNLIRLLTRILFVWFVKEKNLVSEDLFDPVLLKQKYLKDFDPESEATVYYTPRRQVFGILRV